MNSRRRPRLPLLARVECQHASRVERHRGAEERRRTGCAKKCGHPGIAHVDGREHRTAAMRPANEGDASGIDSGFARRPRERAQRIQAPRGAADRPLLGPDGADFAATARIETIGKNDGVAIGEERLHSRRHGAGKLVVVPVARAEHAAAAMQRNDRGECCTRRCARWAKVERGNRDRRTCGVTVERGEVHSLRRGQCSECGRRHRHPHREPGENAAAHHRVVSLDAGSLDAVSKNAGSRNAEIARHAASFSANGRV